MKNIRGIIPHLVLCANPSLNIFIARFDKTEVQLLQPRKKHSGKFRSAYRGFSEDTLHRYRRANVDKITYDPKYQCSLPLYRGECPGWLPLIMMVDDGIVGVVDIMFKYGTDFAKFNILPTEKACTCSIAIVDQYQGLGLGMAFSYITDEIGRHFGMDWILGTTYFRHGMYGIRIKDGWEVIRGYRAPSGDEMIDHRKRLK